MDLREKVIEAGARALYWPYDWDAAKEPDLEVFRARSAAALDAFLDVLEENVNEPFNDLQDMDIFDLLVALRESIDPPAEEDR